MLTSVNGQTFAGLTLLGARAVGELMIEPLAAVTQLRDLYLELRCGTPRKW